MTVQFVAEDTEDPLFHAIDNLERIPEPGDFVYLLTTKYKVERVELSLEDDELVNPVSGQVSPWGLSRQEYKILLSVPA